MTPDVWIVIGILSLFYVFAIFYLKKDAFNGKRGTILVSLALLSLGVLFLYITFSFPSEEGVGPATVPRLWIGLLLILNVYLIFRVIKGIEDVDQSAGDPFKTLKFIVLMIVYIGFLNVLGYFIDTFLFLIIAPLMLYYKRVINLVIISCLWLVFVYYTFMMMLHIPIPMGIFVK